MVIVFRDAVGALLTCTVNVLEPAAPGEPVIAPALEKLRPTGSEPAVMLHE
jgi:hypothetical protein